MLVLGDKFLPYLPIKVVGVVRQNSWSTDGLDYWFLFSRERTETLVYDLYGEKIRDLLVTEGNRYEYPYIKRQIILHIY